MAGIVVTTKESVARQNAAPWAGTTPVSLGVGWNEKRIDRDESPIDDARVRVLQVESDPALAEADRQALNAQARPRFLVQPAEDLASALALIAGVRFDVVLIGLTMDDDGLASLVTLRQAVPDTPIVALLVGQASLTLAEQAMALGVEHCLARSSVPSPLLPLVVGQSIEHYRARAEAAALRLRLDALIEQLPLGYWRALSGNGGRLLEVNPAMTRLFEADAADRLLDRPLAALYQNEEQYTRLARRLLQERVVQDEEQGLVTLHGRPFRALVQARATLAPDGMMIFEGLVEAMAGVQCLARR
jgi:PAS domain-containing protein